MQAISRRRRMQVISRRARVREDNGECGIGLRTLGFIKNKE
jgi:hypothetical protein